MLLEKVRHTLVTQRMLAPGTRVVVAVSGGPDSVTLCHLLHQLRPELGVELVVAHVHHGLRGAEADEDARFVQNLARHLRLPVVMRQIDVRGWQREHGGSLRMAARTLRYHCLRQVMADEKATRLALGHNADDQAEEVLLRLFRGAGPRGLTGIPAVSPEGFVRPLLECHRHEIMDYLHDHGLAWRQDSSNLKPWCQRNLLRLELIPRIQRGFNSNLSATLLRTTKILQEEEDFWQSLVVPWLDRHACRDSSGSIGLPITPLVEAHPAMQRRLLRRALEEVCGHLTGFGFHHTALLMRFCRSGSGNREMYLPNMLVAEKSYGWLAITRSRKAPDGLHYEIPGPDVYYLPQLNHTIELLEIRAEESGEIGCDPCDELMDRDRLSFPLLLRSWRPGDRFRPLGMSGAKKLQDFFIDGKVPRKQRHQVPVLCDSKRIIWVVGHRIDDRVKLTPKTSRILRARYRQGVP